MSGLIDVKTGLRHGTGLYFEPGLGGAGLTNQDEQFDNILFAGVGALTVAFKAKLAAKANFAGSGTLSVHTT